MKTPSEILDVLRKLVAADRKRVQLIAQGNEGPEYEAELAKVNDSLDEVGEIIDAADAFGVKHSFPVTFTEKEVIEAWVCLRKNNSSIPDDMLDQMKVVLLREVRKS